MSTITSNPSKGKTSKRKYLILAALIITVALFPTPHTREVMQTKTLLIDTTGTFMYAVYPGMDETHTLSDLERTAGTNQHHLIKLYVSSTEDVRVTMITIYKTEYDSFDKIHNYAFTTPMTPWVQMTVATPPREAARKQPR